MDDYERYIAETRARDLRALRWNWEDDEGRTAYEFDWDGVQFSATRTDDGAVIKRLTTTELRDAVLADYAARPVKRAEPTLAMIRASRRGRSARRYKRPD